MCLMQQFIRSEFDKREHSLFFDSLTFVPDINDDEKKKRKMNVNIFHYFTFNIKY